MDFYPTLITVSLLLVITGLLVLRIERFYLTEPLLAMLAGLVAGPYATDFLNLHSIPHPERFMEITSALTISMALMATALRLDHDYYIRYARTQSVILLLVMPLMCLSSAILALLLFDIPWQLAFILGAVITPTDPVVSATLVSGKFAEKLLPARIRHTIGFEAAANDGLAFPLVMLTLFMAGYAHAENAWNWALQVVGWETLGAILIGLLLGRLFGRAMHTAHSKGWMDSKSLLSFSIAFAFLMLSLGEVLQANGIITVFVAGLMVNHAVSRKEKLKEEKTQDMMERIFTIPIYFFLGLYLPVDEWMEMGWKLLLFTLLIMLFRRLPAFMLLKPVFHKLKGWRDLLILGWFGPIGVAAIYYAMYVLKETPYREVWIIGSCVIFVSTLIHGISSLPLSRLYAKKAADKHD